MKELIEKITESSVLFIEGNKYKVTAKSHYVTESNPNDAYTKVFMEGHYALVLSPVDDFIYFGKDVGSVGNNFPPSETIEYAGENYKKIAEDYQIVKRLEFGDPLKVEGEVKFIDYENSSNDRKLISVGLIVRNNARADIVASILDIDDIELIK